MEDGPKQDQHHPDLTRPGEAHLRPLRGTGGLALLSHEGSSGHENSSSPGFLSRPLHVYRMKKKVGTILNQIHIFLSNSFHIVILSVTDSAVFFCIKHINCCLQKYF